MDASIRDYYRDTHFESISNFSTIFQNTPAVKLEAKEIKISEVYVNARLYIGVIVNIRDSCLLE